MPDDNHGNALSFGTPAMTAHPLSPPAYSHYAQIKSAHLEYAHHAHPLPIGFEDTAAACPPQSMCTCKTLCVAMDAPTVLTHASHSIIS